MPVMRGYGCSGVLGGQLYVMGGGNSHEWLGDCQRLDLRTGRWAAVSDLQRSGPRAMLPFQEGGVQRLPTPAPLQTTHPA